MRSSTVVVIAIIIALLTVFSWLTMGQHSLPDADFTFIGSSEHRTLDPQKMSWVHEIRIAECLFEPLVRLKLPDLTIEPGAAESWEQTPTKPGEKYVFHLRPTAKWSNGDRLTAHDFVFAWRRAMVPDFTSQYFNLMWSIEGARDFYHRRSEQLKTYEKMKSGKSPQAARRLWEESLTFFDEHVGLRAIDEQTLEVRLAQPTPYFLELCAFATLMPVHRASVEAAVEEPDPDTGRLKQRAWVLPSTVVTNGPYVLAERKVKEYLLLKANPHYWNRAAMENRSILERIVENPQTAVLVYESGDADWLPSLPTASVLAADLVASGRGDVHLYPGAGTYFYIFNCAAVLPDGSPNPLANRDVRRALSMAINREKIVKSVTRLKEPVARTMVPVGALPSYDPPVEDGTDYDPEQAKRLLANAGYPGGKGLSGLSILYNTGAAHERKAQSVQQDWRAVGVEVTLQGIETLVFSERLQNHQFTVARAGWFGDYRDPTSFLDRFRTGDGNNDGKYSNPEFDALMEEAKSVRDPGRRIQLLRRAESVMLQDQPIAPIHQYVQLDVYNPQRVEGLYPNAWHRRRLEQVKVKQTSR